MEHVDDPADMTPGERLEEVAFLLARAYLRLRRRHISEPDPSATFHDSSGSGHPGSETLDFPANQSVNDDDAVDAARDRERRCS